eukprot:1194901-Prorocentrum_minimum.AAC.2
MDAVCPCRAGVLARRDARALATTFSLTICTRFKAFPDPGCALADLRTQTAQSKSQPDKQPASYLDRDVNSRGLKERLEIIVSRRDTRIGLHPDYIHKRDAAQNLNIKMKLQIKGFITTHRADLASSDPIRATASLE